MSEFRRSIDGKCIERRGDQRAVCDLLSKITTDIVGDGTDQHGGSHPPLSLSSRTRTLGASSQALSGGSSYHSTPKSVLPCHLWRSRGPRLLAPRELCSRALAVPPNATPSVRTCCDGGSLPPPFAVHNMTNSRQRGGEPVGTRETQVICKFSCKQAVLAYSMVYNGDRPSFVKNALGSS